MKTYLYKRIKGKCLVPGKRSLSFFVCACVIGTYGCVASVISSAPERKADPLAIKLDYKIFEMDLKVYKDPDKDLSLYKTFAFDYTNKENPLLEKELFKMAENTLVKRGLTRSEDNPDLLITMSFYTGKKESYVPPKTIVTTRIKHVWTTGHIGWTVTGGQVAVPITESHTTPGYKKVSYYENIRVNFLDNSKLVSGEKLEVPPLVWIGEVDSSSRSIHVKVSPDIRNLAPIMLEELINNFPHKSSVGMKREVMAVTYGSIGVKVTSYRVTRGLVKAVIIKEVLPGSPAEAAGLNEGDIILKITLNGQKLGVLPYDLWGNTYYNFEYHTIKRMRDKEVELEVQCPYSKTRQKVRLTPRVVTDVYKR